MYLQECRESPQLECLPDSIEIGLCCCACSHFLRLLLSPTIDTSTILFVHQCCLSILANAWQKVVGNFLTWIGTTTLVGESQLLRGGIGLQCLGLLKRGVRFYTQGRIWQRKCCQQQVSFLLICPICCSSLKVSCICLH